MGAAISEELPSTSDSRSNTSPSTLRTHSAGHDPLSDNDLINSFTLVEDDAKVPDSAPNSEKKLPTVHMEVLSSFPDPSRNDDTQVSPNRLIIGGVEVNIDDFKDYPTDVDVSVEDNGPVVDPGTLPSSLFTTRQSRDLPVLITLTGKPKKKYWSRSQQSYEAGGSDYWVISVEDVKKIKVEGDLPRNNGNGNFDNSEFSNSEWERISGYISPFKEEYIRNLLWKNREVIIRAGEACEGVINEEEILPSVRIPVKEIEEMLENAVKRGKVRDEEEKKKKEEKELQMLSYVLVNSDGGVSDPSSAHASTTTNANTNSVPASTSPRPSTSTSSTSALAPTIAASGDALQPGTVELMVRVREELLRPSGEIYFVDGNSEFPGNSENPSENSGRGGAERRPQARSVTVLVVERIIA